jgi:hypothetical protein
MSAYAVAAGALRAITFEAIRHQEEFIATYTPLPGGPSDWRSLNVVAVVQLPRAKGKADDT